MGLFDKIKSVFAGNSNDPAKKEFEDIINDTYREYASTSINFWSTEVHTTKVWTEQVKNWPDKKKIEFILWMIPLIHESRSESRSWSSEDRGWQISSIQLAYVQTICRNKLIMDDHDAVKIFSAFTKYRSQHFSAITHWPVSHLLNQLEKQKKNQVMSAELRDILDQVKQAIKKDSTYYNEKESLKLTDKIDGMLFEGKKQDGNVKPVKFLGDDELAAFANPVLENMLPAERVIWYQLLTLAQKASGAKPSKKYLDETKIVMKELGIEQFKKVMHEWLQFLIDLKVKEEQHTVNYNNGHTYNYSSFDYLTSVNAEAMKGFVWMCSHFHDNATIQRVAGLAERAFRKIPGKGPTAASLGNACLYTLYQSKGLDGIGQLSRLKLKIKQASTQSLIDKYLQSAAEEQGVTVSEIEDMAVDDCGLVNGCRSFDFDDVRAELLITGIGKTEIKWFKPDGSPQKSVPVIVKEKFAAKLKKVKDIAKQVEQTLTAQRDRIDRMFRNDRIFSKDSFQQYYLNHGLMRYLTDGIIWNFHLPGNIISAIHLNNCWVNVHNEIVDIVAAGEVTLWHPVKASVEEIKAWREFLVFHHLQQPLKQAFRELYLLTDAELATRSYSNRMAAHILRQHQFNSLAKTRGWRYALMGAFDNGIDSEKASLLLPEQSLRAEYWINEVNADNAMNDTGIWNYISTDQVRFINTSTDETVDLINIPPLVFSEVMRDVDLFVGVASVGNDPTWRDTGGIPAYRDYWTSYSFGELSEVAKNRKEILASLLPKLKIRDVATIKDKFVVVKGKRRTYKIHIGSTNILMEPNDQYLCIVPDRNAKSHTENVFLPFEGDTGLSIILSKAFLLADDDQITDTTITSQINRK